MGKTKYNYAVVKSKRFRFIHKDKKSTLDITFESVNNCKLQVKERGKWINVPFTIQIIKGKKWVVIPFIPSLEGLG